MGEIVVVLVVAAVAFALVVGLVRLGVIGKKRLPPLPASGPLAVSHVAKYYELREPPLAWAVPE